MELKLPSKHLHHGVIERFNRTFMELKQLGYEVEKTISGCFNRTFMELKQTYAQMRQRAAFAF